MEQGGKSTNESSSMAITRSLHAILLLDRNEIKFISDTAIKAAKIETHSPKSPLDHLTLNNSIQLSLFQFKEWIRSINSNQDIGCPFHTIII